MRFIYKIWVLPMNLIWKNSWKFGYLMIPNTNNKKYEWMWWKRINFVKLSKQEVDSIYQYYKLHPNGNQ